MEGQGKSYGQQIARPNQVVGNQKMFTASRLMKAHELADACGSYKLLHKLGVFVR